MQNSTLTKLDNLDLKLCLMIDEDLSIKKLPAKVDSLAELSKIARTMCDKHDVPATRQFKLTYLDASNDKIAIMEQDDLEVAYAVAICSSNKLKFTIELDKDRAEQSQQMAASLMQSNALATSMTMPSTERTEVPTLKMDSIATDPKEDVVMEQQVMQGKPGKFGGRKGGMPRRALKSLIQQEMERQSREIFQKIIAERKFARIQNNQNGEPEAQEVHNGVECDGCGVNPIVGPRYKCSVRQNFDYCAECEERLDSEHAFLKIRKPTEAPAFMCTVLPEDAPEGKEDDAMENNTPFGGPWMRRGGRGMRGHGPHGHGRHGHGPHGHGPHGHGPHGHGPHGHGPFGGHGPMGMGMGPCGGPGQWKNMMNKFMENMGVDPEQVKKCAEEWNFKGPRGGCKGEKPWKAKRAQLVNMPSDVLNVFPGQLVMVPMEIRNGTQWPWKQGVFLGMADSVSLETLPCEPIYVQMDKQLKPMETIKLEVPIQINGHALASDDIHEVTLSFRGPNGNQFGEKIPLKMQVFAGSFDDQVMKEEPVQAPVVLDEISQYKMAIKLLENLKLGKDLSQCLQVLQSVNFDEAAAIKVLQSMQSQ